MNIMKVEVGDIVQNEDFFIAFNLTYLELATSEHTASVDRVIPQCIKRVPLLFSRIERYICQERERERERAIS
jgi:hypothetical protein